MADLRELTTDAKRLYEALNYLLEKQDKANADDIDFKEIWFSAKSRPFEHHCIEQLEPEEARSYLLILAGLIALADDADKKKVQIRFLARIIAGYKKADFQLRDIVNDGLLLEEKNVDELLEIKDESTKTCLLVDLLLMVYLDETLVDRQMDYAVGTMAFIGIDKERTYAIGNAVKGILEQNDETVMAQAKYIDIVGMYCYMQKSPDGILVSDLNEARNIVTKKIIFTGINLEAASTIVLDEYGADVIEFLNCEFKNLQGLVCKKKRVILKKCTFLDCEVEENMFILRNAEIMGCKFEGIKTYDTAEKHLFYLLDSHITETIFNNISIQHNSGCPYGGILKAKNTVLKNVTFDGMITRSESNSGCRIVFYFDGGRLVNCSFKNCSLAKNSYLLTISPDIPRSQVVVEGLDSDSDQENIYDFSNRYDLSISDVFEGKLEEKNG